MWQWYMLRQIKYMYVQGKIEIKFNESTLISDYYLQKN